MIEIGIISTFYSFDIIVKFSPALIETAQNGCS